LIEQGLTSPPTQYRLYGRRFLQVKRPNQQYQSMTTDQMMNDAINTLNSNQLSVSSTLMSQLNIVNDQSPVNMIVTICTRINNMSNWISCLLQRVWTSQPSTIHTRSINAIRPVNGEMTHQKQQKMVITFLQHIVKILLQNYYHHFIIFAVFDVSLTS